MTVWRSLIQLINCLHVVFTTSPAAVKTEMFDKPDGPGGDAGKAQKVSL